MKHYSRYFCLLLAFLLSGNLTYGQGFTQATSKKARTLDDYQARTLKGIAAMEPDPEHLRDKQDRLFVTADFLPSWVRVTYKGSTRPIPKFKKEALRQWARLYAGFPEHYTEPYQTEMLFVENGVGYWLAVPTKSLPQLRKQFKKDETLDLYLIRVGGAITAEKYDWTLLVEHFGKPVTAAAEMMFREMRYRKPPLVELIFDVVLRNDRAQPRWFLLPSHMYPEKPGIPFKGGVDTLEVFAPRGKRRVIIGRFLGTGGFQALLLPAHAAVRLRMFPISYWGDVPDQLQVEIVIAKSLTIGGEDAATWFKLNPTSSAGADISENPTNSSRMIRSRHTPDNREVATSIEQDQRITLQVSLRERN
jgi:hypothetical protein